MKGLTVDALADLVKQRFGSAKWAEILRGVSEPEGRVFLPAEDVADPRVLEVFGKACEVLGWSFDQIMDEYGAHWVVTYIPRLYPDFYAGVKSTKEFLLKLDSVHATMTDRLPGAKPPRHHYTWKGDDTLVITYESPRGLFRLFLGAVKGAALRFGERVDVRDLGNQSVEVVFAARRPLAAGAAR